MLQLHQLLASRCVLDLKLTPMVFDLFALRVTKREALALLLQLDLIHTVKCPPPAEKDAE